MATTRIIPLHLRKNISIAQCLKERTDYASNPEKTQKGELVSSFACDPHTVDAEFLLSKKKYTQLTGRDEKMFESRNGVIAYQVRQSFKPGEITPTEANEVGYEFAQRFLKGKHAFLVATHTDRAHIHNHIIWNSTTLDCLGKFRDFLGSGKAVARLSDTICLEHSLSVVERTTNYGSGNIRTSKYSKKLSHRDILRKDIERALAEKPSDFDDFLHHLELSGYTITVGDDLRFHHADFKKGIYLHTLGGDYSKEEICAVIASNIPRKPRKNQRNLPKANLLVDIQRKISEGKGSGYKQWASEFNLKQMAKTLLFLQESGLTNYDELVALTDKAEKQMKELRAEIKDAEKRMAEIKVLRTHIVNYATTRETYVAYRKAGYSKKFFSEHEDEILLHRAAKKAFDSLKIEKIPKVKTLQEEYATLLSKKKTAYKKYYELKEKYRDMLIHRANVERVLEINNTTKRSDHLHDGRE